MSKRVFVLGSTGSIGKSALEVLKHLQELDGKDAWEVAGLSANSNVDLLLEQAAEFDVASISLSGGSTREFKTAYKSSAELIGQCAQAGDLVVAAIVGFAGVEPVLAAIEKGCDIALANKESLVAGGELIMQLAREKRVRIIPIDSEHSAIFQSLHTEAHKNIQKITLTASGGSLRELPADQLHDVSVEQVLNHPTWEMGAKVTVDSASLMNKALELIEAHWLFDVEENQLHAIIHPQSIVHGFVEFIDGSTIAQLSPPDMRLPIQYALTYPDREASPYEKIDWTAIPHLEFIQIDSMRYPAIELAYEVIRIGGVAGTVLNAANEVVVESFLQRKVAFGTMVAIVREVMDQFPYQEVKDFETILEVDALARACANECICSELKST